MKWSNPFRRSSGGAITPAIETRIVPRVARTFPAGEWSDLTADWPISPMTSFQLIHNNLNNLRARARAEARTNDYAKRFVGMLKNGVVGPDGFQLQAQFEDARGIDTVANRAFEKHFAKWANDPNNCDIRGQFDFVTQTQQAVAMLATDGEFIIRKWQRGPMGLQLQLIDPFLLDVTHNDELANGNVIRFGIEINPIGRPVRYHFNKQAPASQNFNRTDRVSIPAAEIYHVFLCESVDQYRGLPWLSTPMYRMHMLNGYEEAAIVNARVGASKTMFKKSRNPEHYRGEAGSGGGAIDQVAPGQTGYLGEHESIEDWSPEYPRGEFKEYVNQVLRGVASGLEVSYPGLANNPEGVNYTSLRHFALEERDTWMRIQRWIGAAFLTPLYNDWLAIRLLSPDGIPIPRAGGGFRQASVARIDKFKNVRWQGRRWQWVDPLKEVQAQKEAIALGVTTRAQVIRDSGRDPEEVFIEVENELTRFGPIQSGDPSNNQANGNVQDPEEVDQSGGADG